MDRKTFFGRDREVRSLLSLVLAEQLVVLFGKSGMGKSSLINAGLSGVLHERGYFPMTVRVGDQASGPVAALVDGVRTAAATAGVEIVGADDSDLWTFFRTAEFWSRTDDLLQPVLVLDQFEELFTLHAPEARQEFILQFAELVRGRDATGRSQTWSRSGRLDSGRAPPKILLALREDHLADLDELARDVPGILKHRFRIGGLDADNAHRAIIEPAMLDDPALDTPAFTYSETALQHILAFLTTHRHAGEAVVGGEVEPVQLQLICQYVEEGVRSRGVGRGVDGRVEVTLEDLGGDKQLQRVLEDFYERTLASIDSPWQRRRVRRLCERRLISAGGRRLTEAEDEIETTHGVSKDRLRDLVNARLLRPEPRLGGVFYELSHDTLVGPILRSRGRRIVRGRVVVAAASGFLLAWLGPWWLITGAEERAEAQFDQFAASGLPGRDDPDLFDEVVGSRFREIRQQIDHGLQSRQGYGALVHALVEVGARYPMYSYSVQSLRDSITTAFVARYDLQPPSEAEDTSLNPRVLIEGGTFTMGSADDSPRHRVTLSAFRIQQHEVTNEEYERFDPGGGCAGEPKQPVVCVTWYESMAYAAWLGGTLPTEAQWEFAARGEAGREYPWGPEEPSCDRAVSGECGRSSPDTVMSRPAGATPEGVHDLAGNASEWVSDWYDNYSDAAAVDPFGPVSGSMRVSRGGSFNVGANYLRGSDRYSSHPRYGSDLVGFRVAWPGPVVGRSTRN